MKYQVNFRTKTRYLHMWKYHRCYGFIMNRAFHTRKLSKWNGLVVHWLLYNKIIIEHYIAAWRYEISLRVLKNISRVSAANEWDIFSTLEEKFVSLCGHLISSISYDVRRLMIWATHNHTLFLNHWCIRELLQKKKK